MTTRMAVGGWLLVLAAGLMMTGCGDSSNSVRPFTHDELREQGQAYQIRVMLQETEAFPSDMVKTSLNTGAYRYELASSLRRMDLAAATVNGDDISISDGQSTIVHDWVAPRPLSDIPVTLSLVSGLEFDFDVPRLVPPRFSGLQDTVVVEDTFSFDLLDPGDYDHVYVQLRLMGGTTEVQHEVDLTEAATISVPVPDTLEYGHLSIDARVDDRLIPYEDVVDDTLHAIEMQPRFVWNIRLLSPED